MRSKSLGEIKAKALELKAEIWWIKRGWWILPLPLRRLISRAIQRYCIRQAIFGKFLCVIKATAITRIELQIKVIGWPLCATTVHRAR
jgi:hypothetical protein